MPEKKLKQTNRLKLRKKKLTLKKINKKQINLLN